MPIFVDWLSNQEWRALCESWSAFEAARITNNRELSNLIGFSYDWFGILFGQARQHVKGAEAVDIATRTASNIIQDLLSGGVTKSKLQAAKNEEDTVKLFMRIGYVRTRREATPYVRQFTHRKGKTVVPLTNLNPDLSITDLDTVAPSETEEKDISDLKRYVMQELEKMENEASDSDKTRIHLAREVAPVRMDVYEPPALNDLLQIFPHIKRTMMYNILLDIQEAYKRVANRFGLEELQNKIGSLRKVAS